MPTSCLRPPAAVASALVAEWEGLIERVSSATIFETPTFLLAWLRTIGADREPRLVQLRDSAGRLVGLAPLCLDPEGRLSFLGWDLADYANLLCEPGREPALVEAVLDEFEATGARGAELHAVPEGVPLLELLPERARRRGLRVEVEQEMVCPHFTLPATYEAYVATLSKKDRHELRRKQRRLEGESGVRWHYVERREDLDPALDTFIQLHRSSKGRKAIFMDAPMERFFREMAAAVFDRGWLQLAFLDVHDQPVACNFGFDYRGTVSLYNSGYNLEFARLSVGLLIVAYGIRHAIEAGRREYDFLRGNEPYKYDLGGTDRRLFGLHLARA